MKIPETYWMTRNLASDLFNEMDHFFDDWNRVNPGTRVYDERTFAPACDVAKSDEHYLMSVDLPGMKKDDIKIEMSDNILTISGERKREKIEKEQKVQCFEKSYGFFKRSFTLPGTLDADKVEAHYENGVLDIYLPKTQAAKTRQIEIQPSKGGIFNKLLGSKKPENEIKDVSPVKSS